jgi:tetratricopeptide (TPR) repeat protein
VGSGRYDFWRVSVDAFVRHPIGGLGQDNFANYYVRHRDTAEEPEWVHSLELRLLTHTGVVGLLLFACFLLAAIAAAVKVRRAGLDLAAGVAGAALLPLVVWAIHGSVDWFWEMPALSGPALGFLGMVDGLGPPRGSPAAARAAPPLAGYRRLAAGLGSSIAFAAALAVLAFPYLSVRETSIASDAQARNPVAALHDFSKAADLNPLDPTPSRLGGTVALRIGRFAEAQSRFRETIAREPGGWFGWLGAGLAASALGERARAHHDYQVAAAINSRQPAVTQALARVYSRHPLTPEQAFALLVVIT